MRTPRHIRDKKRWRKRHTPDGYALLMYESMKRRTTGDKRGYEQVQLTFSREEFIEFLHDTEFILMFDEWEKSGFPHKLAPSVDRIDRLGHYSLTNIQILTAGDNSAKGNEERRYCSACGHKNY